MTVNIDQLKNSQEVLVYKQLKAKQRQFKYSIEYETEVVPYVIERNYLPDFIVRFPSGRTLYIEHKGYLRKDDERKLLAIKRQHPEIDLRIVFQKDGRMSGRKMRYSEWAIKYGFPYSIGSISDDWLFE